MLNTVKFPLKPVTVAFTTALAPLSVKVPAVKILPAALLETVSVRPGLISVVW